MPDDTADAPPAGMPINELARIAEVSIRAVKNAIQRGDLATVSYDVTRVTDITAQRFISGARAARLDQVRAAAHDLINSGHLRPYEMADLFGLDEQAILTAVEKSRLAAVPRGIWLIIGFADAERFAASVAPARRAA
jgi:hypothetical protein